MILGIGAHPDDLEAGCFGTLAKHINEDEEVHLLILTPGAQGVKKYGDTRREEANLSALELGATIEFAGLSSFDLGFPQPKVIDRIAKTIRTVNPYRVYVVSDKDTNQQHWITTQCTRIAARFVDELIQYETVSTLPNFNPNMFVDITEYMDLKVRCLQHHKTQSHRHYFQEHTFRATNAYWYVKGRLTERRPTGYAEAFQIERMIE